MDDENQVVFTPVHKSLIRDNLFMGCEIKMVVLLGVMSFIFIVILQNIWTILIGIACFIVGIRLLQTLAVFDPKMSEVYMRYQSRRKHYDAQPAKSGYIMEPYVQYEP